MFAAIATDETTTSATYVDLATVGPSITVPRAGDYEVTFGATMYDATGGVGVYAAVKRGAAAERVERAIADGRVVGGDDLG